MLTEGVSARHQLSQLSQPPPAVPIFFTTGEESPAPFVFLFPDSTGLQVGGF